jgi:tetratricopeptide (TPR) repeat protein
VNRRTKKLAIVLTIAGLLAASAGGAVAARNFIRERRAQAGLVEGKAAFEKSDFVGAMDGYGRYVSRHPTDADALIMLARARAQVPMENRRHLGSAAGIVNLALEQRPTDKDALALAVDLYTQLGFLTETRQFAQRLIAVDPTNAAAHRANVSALVATSRWEEAAKAADAFIAADPKNPLAHQLAIEVMSLSGADAGAIFARAQTVLADNPKSLALHLLAARTAGAAGETEKLEALLAQAQLLPVETIDELTDLLSLLERMPDSDRRVTEFLQTLSTNTKFAPLANDLRAERDWKFGRLESAATHAQAAIKSPESASGRAVVLALLTGGTAEDVAAANAAAASLATRTAQLDPAERYWSAVASGIIARRAADYAKARESLADAIRLDARPGFAQFLLAELLFPMGERAEAIRLMESIVGAGRTMGDPSWRVARSRLVQMKVESGRLTEARESAGVALSLRPALAEALSVGYAALISYDAGNLPRTDLVNLAEAMSKFEGEAAKDASILGMRAWAAFALGQPDKGQTLIKEIIAEKRPPLLEISLRLLNFARGADLRANPNSSTDAAAGLHGQLLTFLRDANPNDRVLLGYNAAYLAATQGVPAARALLDEAAAMAPADQRSSFDLLFARAVENVDPKAALAIYNAAVLVPTPPGPPITVLLAIADSEVAWTDADLIARAVTALRDPLGPNSSRFRVLDARRRMSFERSNKVAAEVVTSLTPVVEADRRDVLATVILADAFNLIGNRKAAADTLQRAIDVTGAPNLYPQYISILQASGRGPDADRALRRFSLIGAVPDGIRRERIQLLANQGLLAEALADSEALGDRRTSNDLLLTAAMRTRMGDASGAAADIAAARAKEPTSAAATFAAADALAKSGDLDGALALIQSLPDAALNAAGKQAASNELLVRYATPERVETALRAAAQSATEAPQAAAAWAQLADFLAKAGRTDDASAAVEEGLKIAPTDARLGWLKGTIALTKGGDDSLQSSLATLAQAASNPDMSPVLRDVVEVMKSLAVENPDWTRASRRLTEIVEQHPTELDVRALLVRAHFNAGNTSAALAAARQAADALPGDFRGARLAASALAAGGQTAEALVMGQRWRQLTSSNPTDADRFIASCHIDLNQPAEALKVLEPYRASIVSAMPPDVGGLNLLARAMIGTGQFAPARAIIDPALATEPRLIELAIDLARTMAAAPSGTAPAREWLGSLAAGSSEVSPTTSVILAQAWLDIGIQTGDPAALTSAIAVARAASTNTAADANIRIAAQRILANALDLSGDLDGAIAAYTEVKAQSPDDIAVLNNLAYSLVRKRERLPEAVEMAKRVIELSKDQPSEVRANYMDTLAQAQLAAGQPAEALATFTTALTLVPMMPDLLLGTAECHLALGDKEKARESLTRLATIKTPLSPPLQARATKANAAAK